MDVTIACQIMSSLKERSHDYPSLSHPIVNYFINLQKYALFLQGDSIEESSDHSN